MNSLIISVLIITLIQFTNISLICCGYDFRQLSNDVRKSQCSISGASLLLYYVIKCPDDDVKLHVVLGPGTRTKIYCFNMEYLEFQKILPNLTIGSSGRVEIKDCPLPESQGISSILEQLGIISYETIVFNNKMDLGQKLNKIHFSNFKKFKNLTLILENVAAIPDDLFEDVSLIDFESLDFYSNIEKLPENIFMNLKKLDFIALGRNLHSLPLDIFRYQTNLTELTLSNNKLTNLTKEMFRYSSTLKSLDLENNLLELLESDVFTFLTNIIRLKLGGNRFTTLPPDLFLNNKKLIEFSLTKNQVSLKELPDKLLANLPRLDEVTLECGLEKLPRYLIQNSTNIVTLSMADNKMTYVPRELLKGQQNLKHLNVSHNLLGDLPETLIESCISLLVFDVSHNNISSFTSLMFHSNMLLEVINFSNNKLTFEKTLIFHTFRFQQSLKLLNFSHNFITKVSKNWMIPYFLEFLDLSHNNITLLKDHEIINLIVYNLELDLTYNQIRTIQLLNYTTEHKDFQRQLLKVDLNFNPIVCDCKIITFVEFFQNSPKYYNLKENLQFLVKNLKCAEPADFKGNLVKNLYTPSLVCEYKDKCPINCWCSLRSYDETFIVDCSKRDLYRVPNLSVIQENDIKQIELNLQDNHLLELPEADTPGYANVTKLLVANNNIKEIYKKQLPLNLTYLDLRGNYLKLLNSDILTFMNQSKLSQVYLSNNSWMCDCEAKPLLRFAQSNLLLFKDFTNMTCANTEHLTYFYDLLELCPIERKFYIFLLIILAVICLLFAFYYKYQTEIKVWLYAHNMCLWLVSEEELDQDKVYDAFISYSAKDEDFVLDTLLPELENGQPSFKLCVHVRDWLVGDCIPDQIVRSVAMSKKTIIILTKYFIESVWAKMEFKMAHQAALSEGRAKVIVIIYEDIANVETLDEDLKAYLKMNTYLKWGDPWFWQKLRYAMPHVTRDHRRLFENVQMQEINREGDTRT